MNAHALMNYSLECVTRLTALQRFMFVIHCDYDEFRPSKSGIGNEDITFNTSRAVTTLKVFIKTCKLGTRFVSSSNL